MTSRYVVRNGLGVSAESEPVSCTTRPFSPPAVLTVSDSTKNSLTLSWAKPVSVAHALRNSVLQYDVVVKDENRNTKKSTVVSSLGFVVTGLDPSMMYCISVSAKLGNDKSEDATIQFATAPSAPAAPTSRELQDNRATFGVAVGAVQVPAEVSKEILLIKFYKMEGDQQIDGSQRVYAQRLKNGNDAIIDLASLASGTKYGVQVKLMVKVGDKLVNSAFSDQTTFTTTITGSPVSDLIGDIDQFKADSKQNLDSAKVLSDKLSSTVADGTVLIDNLLRDGPKKIAQLGTDTSDKFTGVQQISNSLQKVKCVVNGYQYYTNAGSIATVPNVSSIQECLAQCADRDGCVSVSFHTDRKSCELKTKRMGMMMYALTDYQSANLICSVTDSASIDTWKSCVKEKKNFPSADLTKSLGINSIEECVAFCQITDDCTAVTFVKADKTCYLKNKRNGNGVAQHDRCTSVNMACMAAVRSTTHRCHHNNTVFSGSEIGSTSTGTLEECIAYCGNLNFCESVSYNSSTKSCKANSKRKGASQSVNSGWTSVNMYCLGLSNV